MYHCRSCNQDVKEVHICGKTPKGNPVVVQYVNRYPAYRGREFMKSFGSHSEAKQLYRFQNMVEKGWDPSWLSQRNQEERVSA